MKIVVLMGSPNRKGSTNILVREFTRGAEESGKQVKVVDKNFYSRIWWCLLRHYIIME